MLSSAATLLLDWKGSLFFSMGCCAAGVVVHVDKNERERFRVWYINGEHKQENLRAFFESLRGVGEQQAGPRKICTVYL